MNAAKPPTPELCIWRFSDSKAGHDSQSRGLSAALLRRRPGTCHDIKVSPQTASLWQYLFREFPKKDFSGGAQLPPPDVLIGAGHATHLPMLHARRSRGGRIAVLMQPSLPLGCFDFCFIPEHDAPAKRANVFPTQGALNSIRPADDLDAKCGLILLGGASRHFHWDEQRLKQQIDALLEKSQKHWLISDSRRTPAASRKILRALAGAEYRPWESCTTGWLEQQLRRAATVWVSQDSISMLYEAASAGGQVGMLELEARHSGRLFKASRRLIEQGRITPFSAWQQGAALACGRPPLQEAARCADILAQRLAQHGEGRAWR